MSDTWATLEQRFRNLADKSPELIIEASPSESEWKTGLVKGPFGTFEELVLSGWKPTEAGWESDSGVWNWYVSGPKGELYIEELELLIHRADRLLNHHTQYKSRFLNVVFSQYGKAGAPEFLRLTDLHSIHPPVCFSQGAFLCSLTAGYLLGSPDLVAEIAGTATTEANSETKPPKNCRASENDIRKFDFYEKARNKSPHVTHGEVAIQWNRQFKNEEQTEQGMRQAVNRGKKFKDWQRDNS